MTEQLKVIISAEIAKLKQNVEDAKKGIKGFQEQVKEASKNVDEDFQKAGESIKTGLAIGAAAFAAVSAGLLALAGSTKEYRQQQAQLKTAFETAGGSAATATETYNDLYRVLGDSGQATEAAQHLAKLTTEEKALSEWTNICQGVYATFGSSLPLESLTEAVNHSAKLGEVQGSLADALEWSGISVDEFNEQLFWCNSESEREALIRNTLNGIYSDAAGAYEENNAAVLAQNEAQAKLDETLATLGETLAPVIALFTSLAADALAAVMPYIQSFAENHLPAVKELLSGIGEALGNVLNFLIEYKAALAAVAGAIGIVVAAVTLYNIVTGIKAAMDAAQVTSIWGLVASHMAQAAAAMAAIAPYILIVAAIAAVIAIIVLCVKYWDEIVAAVKKAVATMINTISGFTTSAKETVAPAFAWIKDKIVNPIKDAFNNIKTIFSNIVSTIKDKLNSAKDTVKGIIDKIKGFFKFEWSLPKLKVPKFSITPSGWGIGDLLKGSIPKLSVSWNKLGGVFEKPTIMSYGNSLQGLGEDGAEAIVPLENNLEWLNKLANMLGDRMGVGTPVILNIDGKTFAQTTIKAINNNTKQTGKLGLKIV